MAAAPVVKPRGIPVHTEDVWDGHEEPVLCVCYSADGKWVVAACHDKSLSVWEITQEGEGKADGRLLQKLSGGHLEQIYWCAFSPDLTRIASAAHDETIVLWDTEDWRNCGTLRGHDAPVRSVVFHPAGQLLASGSYDKTIKLWDLDKRKCVQTLKGHSGQVRSVDFHPDGSLLASGSNDATVQLWLMPSGEKGLTLTGHKETISTVAFSPSGALLASASYDHTIRLWDPSAGTVVREMQSDDQVLSCSWSRDESMLTTTNNASKVRVWDTATGSCKFTCHGHTAPVFCARFGPHGRMLVSGSHDSTIRMWDLRSDEVLNYDPSKDPELLAEEADRVAAEQKAIEDAEQARKADEENARREAEREKARQLAEAEAAASAAAEAEAAADAAEKERLAQLAEKERLEKLKAAELEREQMKAAELKQQLEEDAAEQERQRQHELRLKEDQARKEALEERQRRAEELLNQELAAQRSRADNQALADKDWNQNPVTVAAGGWFSLVIGEDGRTYSLGDNLYGQCGHGEDCKDEYTAPTPIYALPQNQVRHISAGEQHSLFVLSTGQALACGSNEHGQLGVDHINIGASSPVPVEFPVPDWQIKRAMAGGHHSVFLAFDGSVWTVGHNLHGQLGLAEAGTVERVPAKVELPGLESKANLIDAGPQCSAAVLESGVLLTWGDPVEGQLGHTGSVEQDPLFHHYQVQSRSWNVPTPREVTNIREPVELLSVGGTVQLTKGAGHMVAYTADQTLWSWGMNKAGQLGRETVELDYGCISPRSSKAPKIQTISADAAHAWVQQSAPTQCAFQHPEVVKVAAGGEHTFMLDKSGVLHAFGHGNHGQIGASEAQGEQEDSAKVSAVQVALEQPITTVAAGVHHTIAVGKDGECYIWGDYSSSIDHASPSKAGIKAFTATWPDTPVPDATEPTLTAEASEPTETAEASEPTLTPEKIAEMMLTHEGREELRALVDPKGETTGGFFSKFTSSSRHEALEAKAYLFIGHVPGNFLSSCSAEQASAVEPSEPASPGYVKSSWNESDLSPTHDSAPVSMVKGGGFESEPSSPLSPAPVGAVDIWKVHGEDQPILCCCYTKDGKHVVAACHDHTLSIHEIEYSADGHAKGKFIRKLADEHGMAVYWCAMSPDIKTVASGSHDETIVLWSLEEGKAIATLRGHEEAVRSVAFHPAGQLLASGSYDKTIKLWDLETHKCVQTLKGHTHQVRSVDFHPDGSLLASGSNDATVQLWLMPSGEKGLTLTGHKETISTVAFSPSGALLASASYDQTVRLWNSETGITVRTLQSDDQVLSCSFSRDESMLTTTNNASKVRVWNTNTGVMDLCLEGHTAPVFCARFGPHGRMLVSGSHDSTIRMWDLKYEREQAELRRRLALEVEMNKDLDEAELLNKKMAEACREAKEYVGAEEDAPPASQEEVNMIRDKLKNKSVAL